MFLYTYSGKAFRELPPKPEMRGSSRSIAQSDWVSTHSLCVCPKCIAEARGAWQLQWLLPWTFACSRHNVVLAQHCTECSQPLRSSSFSERSALPLVLGVPRVGCCVNRLPLGKRVDSTKLKCDFMLSQLQATSIAEWPAMVAAQQQLNCAIEGEETVVGGDPAGSAYFFNLLKVICKLLLFANDMSLLEDLPEEVADHIQQLFSGYQRQYSNASGFQRGEAHSEPHLAYRDNNVMAAILPTATRIAADSSRLELVSDFDKLLYHAFKRSRARSTRVRDLLASRIFPHDLRYWIAEALKIPYNLYRSHDEYEQQSHGEQLAYEITSRYNQRSVPS